MNNAQARAVLELRNAKAALAASLQATRTHGHQHCTWVFLQSDLDRVARLEAAIAKAEEGGK
jgi:hypothetical protein